MTHSSFLRLALTLLTVPAVSSCTAPPPPQTAKEPARNFSFTRTWISAVGSMGWPTARECEIAQELIAKEKDCEGSACNYAAEISADYLATCAQDLSPEKRATASKTNDSLSARAAEAPGACTRTPRELIDYTCSTENKCDERAQTWATRCAEQVASPLLVRFLQAHVRDALDAPDFTIDTTSCTALGEKFVAANACDDVYECQEEAKPLESFLRTCASGDASRLTLEHGLAIFSILEKSEQPRDVAIAPELAQWRSDDPLVVADGKAKIIKFCGARPQDTGALIEARAGCSGGAVELYTVHKDRQGGHQLHRVTVPYASEQINRLLTPWLFNRAESVAAANHAARELKTAVESFATAAASTGPWRDAVAALLVSLEPIDWSSIPEEELRAIWAPHDEALARVFGLLGSSKGRGVSPRASDSELQAYLYRTGAFPFADLDNAANVRLKKRLNSAALPIAQALPISMKAYVQGLLPVRQKLSKYRPSPAERSAQETALRSVQESCTDALAIRDHAQVALMHCAFRDGSCEVELVANNAAKVRSAYKTWQAAWLDAKLASANEGDLPVPECPAW